MNERAVAPPLDLPRALAAEGLGAAALIVVGAGTVVLTASYGQQVGLLSVALAHGLVIGVMIAALGRFSGAHFNPAVTAAVWVGGKITAPRAAAYVAAQSAGAVLGAALLVLFFNRADWDLLHLGTPTLAGGVDPGRAILIEAVLTFFLAFTVWSTGVDPRGGASAAPAVGAIVLAATLVGAPLTGAALNPVRALGPAALAGFWTDQWVFWVGPVAGGAIAGLLYRTVFFDETLDAQAAPPAAGTLVEEVHQTLDES